MTARVRRLDQSNSQKGKDQEGDEHTLMVE